MIDEPKIACFYKKANNAGTYNPLDVIPNRPVGVNTGTTTLTDFEKGIGTSHITDTRHRTPAYYGSPSEDSPTTPLKPGVGSVYKSVDNRGKRAYSIPYLSSAMGVSSKRAGEYLDKVNAARGRDPNNSFDHAFDSYAFAPDVNADNVWSRATDGKYNARNVTEADKDALFNEGPMALFPSSPVERGGLLMLNSGMSPTGARVSSVPYLVNSNAPVYDGSLTGAYKLQSNDAASTGFNRHPYTNLNMTGLFGINGDFSHEFNHLLNNTPDARRAPLNPLNDLVASFRANSSDGFNPYGGYSVEEATQQASSMKHLAANMFAKSNGGRLPDTDDEWRSAFSNALGDDTVNPEQLRFKNYMTPVQDNVSPEDRKTMYRKNVGRFIDTLMKRNSAGDRLLDLIVKNDYDGAGPGELAKAYTV